MRRKYLSFAIVLVGKDHNPSILNQDFLINNKIINSSWEIEKRAPFLITPIQTFFFFKNAIQFQIDQTRLIVKDHAPDGEQFPVPELVTKYVRTLPHVNYKSIGINFETGITFDGLEDAANFYKRFIKDGPWSYSNKLEKAEIKFVYKVNSAIFNFNISLPVLLNIEERNFAALVAYGNFHRELDLKKEKTKRVNDIIKIIKDWEKDSYVYTEILNLIFGDINGHSEL